MSVLRPAINLRPFALGAVALALTAQAPEAADVLIQPRHEAASTVPPEATAGLARTLIGSDSRYVLRGFGARLLRDDDLVELPEGDSFALELDLPDGVGTDGDLLLSGWLSVRDQSAKTKNDDARLSTEAAPAVHLAGSGRRATVRFPLDPRMRGRLGRVSVVARSLPAGPIRTIPTPARTIGEDSILSFSFAVEEASWREGSPPVVFRVKTDSGETLYARPIDPAGDPRERRWFDASVDLSGLAGKKVGLVFESEALVDASGVTVPRSLAVFANPVIHRRRPPATDRPNVVLISLDTLRAGNLSAYGYSRATSPQMDRRVAAAGARVETAVAPAPFTPPSHMTMLTGTNSCTHGVTERNSMLRPEVVTLAERLRAGGWATSAFTENGFLIAGSGFDRGFDVYLENRSEEKASPGFAEQAFGGAMDWIRREPRRPFFTFIHTYQVHAPYTPPRSYGGLFVGSDSSEIARKHDDYDREIRYTDDIVGHFLDFLEKEGLAENTLVVVTSDHGEEFGEHGAEGHGPSLFDETLLVPMMFRWPGRIPKETLFAGPVGLIDLTPTLLELIGQPTPAVAGQSFAGALRGERSRFEPRPVVSASTAFGEAGADGVIPALRSVRTEKYKYVRTLGGELFFDLSADPAETRNLAGGSPEGLKAARQHLDRHLDECRRLHRDREELTRTRTRPEPVWWNPALNTLDRLEETRRKLESLGYVQ